MENKENTVNDNELLNYFEDLDDNGKMIALALVTSIFGGDEVIENWDRELKKADTKTPFLKRVNNIEKNVEKLQKSVDKLEKRLQIIIKSLRS